ncbi:hypothetical protein ASG49_08735 [Marmoricola sp. Leaf446]|uniref:tRNA adenosine deaminase-associated protein n=1 Tax=Marmoricola sp. Leaf446 TaxID=1736379 RepID=UPI000700AE30|nr:tRNA adenosine deaminase-associated protein [Marmoricola sp. Leaf446]KQT92053.1 hypothetical protein ASG49_08735 [Marmoricola sp. Leaf446]
MSGTSDAANGAGDGRPDEVDEVDVAVLAYRDEGDWVVDELPDDALVSVAALVEELQRWTDEDGSDGGALALVSVAEDFALLVRVQGATTRVLLTDASAATEWALARSATEHLGMLVEDDDETAPAGDLGIVADLGMPASELGELLDDEELFPEELLSEVADAAGFGADFDDLVDLDD